MSARKYISILSSFIIMLCLGSVYGWSIFVNDLKIYYAFTASQTQIVFGTLIAIFSLTMIWAGKLEIKYGPKKVCLLSAITFGSGYLLASFSGGNFYLILIGIGVLAGIGTGLGYLISISNSAKLFPDRKGLVTGIIAAGFGFGAVLLTYYSNYLFTNNYDVLEIFRIVGISYGVVISIFALLISRAELTSVTSTYYEGAIKKDGRFYKLFFGIFCGTFSGLLVIGNLKPMGAVFQIDNKILLLGVSVFSVANFAGRIFWGWLSDIIKNRICIMIALFSISISVFLIGVINLSSFYYIFLAAMIGFSFGANFVLFAKETANYFGVNNIGFIYPYVFLGYGLAGIMGPYIGGLFFDVFKNYNYSAFIASATSAVGALIFTIKRFNKDSFKDSD